MVYWSLMHILTFFLDFFTMMCITYSNKDLEIIILRQQVHILQTQSEDTPADI
jgi:hypothetical protein